MMANSLGWASFMFISTNPRYQMVNAVEQVASPPGSLSAARL